MSEWISVETNPKARGNYLVWIPEAKMMGEKVEAHFSIIRWNGKKFYSSFPITHWMSLPEPPK